MKIHLDLGVLAAAVMAPIAAYSLWGWQGALLALSAVLVVSSKGPPK
jgi:hypothetical protein